MKRDVVEIYNYFVSKVYQLKSYEFFSQQMQKSNKRVVIDFLTNLHTEVNLNEVDRDYIFDYCSFQFEYMLSKSPRYVEQRMPLKQVFNKTGIQRWLERKDGYMYYVGEALLEKGIYREEINPPVIRLRTSTEIIQVEEIEKSRFHNRENGFAHCIISTSLYNHNSLNCITCKSGYSCKALLKKTLLPIYIDRGYEF